MPYLLGLFADFHLTQDSMRLFTTTGQEVSFCDCFVPMMLEIDEVVVLVPSESSLFVWNPPEMTPLVNHKGPRFRDPYF